MTRQQITDVPQALSIESADQYDWDNEQDVVVVGFGGAGVAAALESVQQGATVLAVDRFFGGGATARSGGVVYAGGGTPIQKSEGVEDTPEQMFEYLKMEVGDAVREETLRRFCDQSVTNLQWLQHHHVEFAGNIPPVKTSYPTDQYYLYYSGNEAVSSYAEQVKPAPRGHRVKGKGLSGEILFAALRKSALSRGVKLQVQTEAIRLITDQNNQVVGIEVRQIPPGSSAARRHKLLYRLAERSHNAARKIAFRLRDKLAVLERAEGVVKRIRARKGVILSAGGFVMNQTMMEQYGEKYAGGLQLGTSGCTGSGIRLGQGAGGAVDRMDKISAWRFINPPLAFARGIVVNPDGERFCSEDVYGAKLGYELVEKQNNKASLIFNGALRKQALSQSVPGKLPFFQYMPALMAIFMAAKKANTLEELADYTGAPLETLMKTLHQYSKNARTNTRDPLGKAQSFMANLDEGPWYVLNLDITNEKFPCPMITLGGLQVNEETGEVLNEDGGEIKGLYSAGRNAVGVASNLYVSGLSIADCIFSGRRAGRHVVKVDAAVGASVEVELAAQEEVAEVV